MFDVFGITVTGEIITMWAIIAVITVFSLVMTRRFKERPGRIQNILESGVEYIENFLRDILGKQKTEQYFAFFGTMFIFIMVSNYLGFLPGANFIPGFNVPTSSLSVTIGLSVCTFFALQYYSARLGFRHYIKRFVKPVYLLPLLLLDEIIKPVSLSLRLYGNIYGEESVTSQLYEIFPIGVPVIMMLLSLLFCYIQAVVFTMLSAIYIDEATATD